MIINSSKNNKTKARPNKFNNFPFFYPLKNINPNGIFNNNIFQTGIKRQYNNFTLNIKNKKYNNKFKADNYKDLYQESISHLSTTSGGDYNNYNKANNNNYYLNKNFIEEKKNNKNENLFESIKKGINDIKDYINSNQNNSISLSCYYYCNININEQQKKNLQILIQKSFDIKDK